MSAGAVETFVRRSIKARSGTPDAAELRQVLEAMTTEDIQMFWLQFVGIRSLRTARMLVADWRTREQKGVFERECFEWNGVPTRKDEQGKSLVERSDLIAHVSAYLLRNIEEQRAANRAFAESPLYDRIHAWIGMAVVYSVFACIPCGVLIFVLDHFLHTRLKDLIPFGIGVWFVLYAAYLVLPLIIWIVRRCRARVGGA